MQAAKYYRLAEKGGNKTLVKQANTTLAYNSENDLSYKVEKQGNQTVATCP